jgi:lysophospholipase L1-like esterase
MKIRTQSRLITGLALGISTALLVGLTPKSTIAQTETVNYTALGDSVPFGIFAPAGEGYVPLYRGYLQTDTGVNAKLTNLAVPGWSSADLSRSLRRKLLFRGSIATSQVVTWSVGGNDLLAARNLYKAGRCGGADNQECIRITVSLFKANWDTIMAELLELRSTSNTSLRTTDIYNPFVQEDQAEDSWANDGGLTDFQVIKLYLEQVNAHIASTASSHGIPYAPVYAAYNGPNGDQDPVAKGYIAFDGYHPNRNGHRVIADLLRGLGYAPLR